MLKQMVLGLLIALCYGATVHAAEQQYIYKWTDELGKPKYSELPPPKGVPYETVKRPGSSSAGISKTEEDVEKERKQLEELEAKEKEEAEQAKKKVDDARAKNCEIVTKNVEVLSSSKPVIKTDDKGTKYIIDDDQRAAELKKAQKDKDYYCNP